VNREINSILFFPEKVLKWDSVFHAGCSPFRKNTLLFFLVKESLPFFPLSFLFANEALSFSLPSPSNPPRDVQVPSPLTGPWTPFPLRTPPPDQSRFPHDPVPSFPKTRNIFSSFHTPRQANFFILSRFRPRSERFMTSQPTTTKCPFHYPYKMIGFSLLREGREGPFS